MRQVAVIGSGPSGCYLADQLLRLMPDARVDVVDRLPVPFGLVRHGVAPDHQGTKAVARLLDRILAHDRAAFFGNVEVGRDVTLEQLGRYYDAVVLATGASIDRRSGLPGEDLAQVMGSGRLVAWYNGHPDRGEPDFGAGRTAVVIGHGNVAIDIARILAKTPEELAGSDLDDAVADRLAALPLTRIHVVGRRGPQDAKFTAHELGELGRLARARPVISGQPDLAGETPVMTTFRGFAGPAEVKPIEIVFHFGLVPQAFVGADRLEAVRFAGPAGEVTLPADFAVTCIGYETQAVDGCAPAAHDGGLIRPGLYVVGWAGRGPSGTIPTNRTEAQGLAKRMAGEIVASGRSGREALRAALTGQVVDHAGWKKIDTAELAQASERRVRVKLTDTATMLRHSVGGFLDA
jgi:ferredoxin--NADP+ reductase